MSNIIIVIITSLVLLIIGIRMRKRLAKFIRKTRFIVALIAVISYVLGLIQDSVFTDPEPPLVLFILWGWVVVIVIEIIILTEGEAQGDEGKPEQGDFPEPDPDDDRPA